MFQSCRQLLANHLPPVTGGNGQCPSRREHCHRSVCADMHACTVSSAMGGVLAEQSLTTLDHGQAAHGFNTVLRLKPVG
jgi:hypothetical protein